jgi:hypothetical protein
MSYLTYGGGTNGFQNQPYVEFGSFLKNEEMREPKMIRNSNNPFQEKQQSMIL